MHDRTSRGYILFTFLLAPLLALPCTAGSDDPAEAKARAEIVRSLESQSAAWSRGDLETFCAGYDEQAVFVSPSGLTRGRQEILDRYRRRYRNRDAMGRLSLEPIDVRISGAGDGRYGEGASVVAHWRLSYDDREEVSGLTLIVLERREEGWIIVHDASM